MQWLGKSRRSKDVKIGFLPGQVKHSSRFKDSRTEICGE